MFKWVIDWWHSTQRSVDLEILWPACKENSTNLDHAKAAFAYHAFNDSAWLCLGEDEIKRRINHLT